MQTTLRHSADSVKDVVFRIQDKDGRGPWKPGFSKKWVEDREDHNNLLTWYVESGPVHTQVIFGAAAGSACKTIEQLRRWFVKSEYEKLLTFGYQSYMVPVDRIIAESEIQCFVERSLPFNSVDIEPINLY